MSFESTDLGFMFTADGGPEDGRETNLGGAVSETAIIHSQPRNFAPDIPRTVVEAIGTQGTWSMYFPYYVQNNHDSITITDVKATIYKDVNSVNINVQMGFDPAGKNGTCQVIANQTTAPSGVTFQNPVTSIFGGWWVQTTVWNIAASLAPGDRVPLWIRLFGPKGVSSIPSAHFGIKVTFVRPAEE